MVKTYNWKITAEKAFWVTAEVVVAGALVYVTDNSVFLAIVPLLEAAKNWLKHKN